MYMYVHCESTPRVSLVYCETILLLLTHLPLRAEIICERFTILFKRAHGFNCFENIYLIVTVVYKHHNNTIRPTIQHKAAVTTADVIYQRSEHQKFRKSTSF